MFQEEITDIRIKGMRHHFIYEEFHPNQYDIKEDVKNLLESIFKCGSDHKYFDA
ncbi:MAG: hypothetical protein R2942_16295 [Ignavibacteria bacterium]